MLEKPDLPDDQLINCLRQQYRLDVSAVEFLPLGADANTAVYRASVDDAATYFVKLRSGDFDELTIVVPHLLHTQGVPHLIAPFETHDGQLWTRLDRFAVMLYPFIDGQDGFTLLLSPQQWTLLGETLKGVHTARLPDQILARLPRESYTGYWRERVRGYQAAIESSCYADPISAQLADLMRDKRAVIDTLIERAAALATLLQQRSLEFVLCHADIHGGNVLLPPSGEIYVVDWDTLLLAPKERDLMFIGGGIGKGWGNPAAVPSFYMGYGSAEIDPAAIAYYRYERIVEDIAAFCEEILESNRGDADRAQSLVYLLGNFMPDGVTDIAFRTDQTGLFGHSTLQSG